MKEITLIVTSEITKIEQLDDEELKDLLGDMKKAGSMVENELKKNFSADDVHAKVKFFVRDIDDDKN